MKTENLEFKKFTDKIEAKKKSGEIDLSLDEDLSIAVMNLISLEEHFFFTGAKTEKPEYYELQNTVREMRKDLLGRLIKKTEGETWCISKHLLAVTMRLIEVGTKLQASGRKEEAEKMFSQAYSAYSMFWMIRLRVGDGVSVAVEEKENTHWSAKDITDRLINCCEE
jgi:hypothetical protein